MAFKVVLSSPSHTSSFERGAVQSEFLIEQEVTSQFGSFLRLIKKVFQSPIYLLSELLENAKLKFEGKSVAMSAFWHLSMVCSIVKEGTETLAT